VRALSTLPLILGAACAAAVLGFAGPAAAAATASDPLTAADNEACLRCHASADADEMVDVDGEQESIGVDREVYGASRHGQLACTSCHIGFKPGVHTTEQTDGWVETAMIGACRDCHADIFQMYRSSLHGELVFGQSNGEAPVCADCHEAHNILPPDSAEFRAGIDDLCAECHEYELQTYLDSYHGKAFHLGEEKTAVCSDCHGGHKILPASDPESMVSEENLVATCAQCHPGANENFAGFLVHVDPQDPQSSLLVWVFYAAYIMLIAVVFTFGFVHSGLYIYRGFKDGLYKRKHHG